MTIARTPMVDDDGSGTTGTILNNAWKQELYNQIDAEKVTGPWTPVDASGAGLVFATAIGRYWRLDKFVAIQGRVIYPTTANAANATIGGLPAPNGGCYGGLYKCDNLSHGLLLAPGAGSVLVVHPTTGLQVTNANLSGIQLIFSGVYLIA